MNEIVVIFCLERSTVQGCFIIENITGMMMITTTTTMLMLMMMMTKMTLTTMTTTMMIILITLITLINDYEYDGAGWSRR